MPDTINLSESYSIEAHAADLILGEIAEDPLFDIFPPVFTDAWKVFWEIEQNPYGLMPPRGGGGEPENIPPPGWKEYSVVPSYYGGQTTYGERELTESREMGTKGEPIDVDRHTMRGMANLVHAATNQIRNIIIKLLLTGQYDIRSDAGHVSHADYVAEHQKLVPSTAWSNIASDPILDLLTWQATLQRGTSTDFGPNSWLLMGDESIRQLMLITKIRDNMRIGGGDTVNGLTYFNKVLTGYDLPTIVRYNRGYYPTKELADNKANFVKFLEIGQAIWVGKREDGDRIGQFQMTKNLMKESPLAATVDARVDVEKGGELEDGMYALVNYQQTPPPKLRMDVGFNGGPAFIRPTATAGITWS